MNFQLGNSSEISFEEETISSPDFDGTAPSKYFIYLKIRFRSRFDRFQLGKIK